MRAALVFALVAVGCKIDLDHGTYTPPAMCVMGTSPACIAAASHQELTWLQANVFTGQCSNFSGCHNGDASLAGKDPDLRDGHTFAALVDQASVLDKTRKLVVPGDPPMSYLMVMVGQIAPKDALPAATLPKVGLMPQNAGSLICCQKLDAIERWIMDGAMNN